MKFKKVHSEKGRLVASIFELSFEELVLLKALKEHVEILELRADVIGDRLDFQKLKKFNKLSLIFVLRSKEEGGYFDGGPEERKKALIAASKYCRFIELEGARDLQAEILEAIPPGKRIISWYGSACSVQDLENKLETFDQTEAAFYRIIPNAIKIKDSLAPLLFLKKINRQDVISYASGTIGQWTQIIAPALGAGVAFGALIQNNKTDATFSISQLVDDYNLPTLPQYKNIFGIVGNPVFRSRSPKMHNNAYRTLNMAALYLPFQIEDFKDFWENLVCAPEVKTLGISFKGFTVVSPFKKEALIFAEDTQSPIIPEANACNVLTKQNGIWETATTDYFGLNTAINNLELNTVGLKVAIIGCGGAGRTMAVGLKQDDADVLLVNRSIERGHQAAQLLGLPFMLLSEFSPKGFDLIINATPLGKHSNEAPFDLRTLQAYTAVIDLTYSKGLTALVRYSLKQGNKVISGRNILLFQVLQQFKLLTGKEMPYSLAWDISGIEEEKQFLSEIINNNGNKKQNNVAIQESR